MSIINFEKHFSSIKSKLDLVKEAVVDNGTVTISDNVSINLSKVGNQDIATGPGDGDSTVIRVCISSDDVSLDNIRSSINQGNYYESEINTKISTTNTTLTNIKTGVDTINTNLGTINTNIDDTQDIMGNIKNAVDNINTNSTTAANNSTAISSRLNAIDTHLTDGIAVGSILNDVDVNATIVNTPSVTLSGSLNDVNATLVGTPAVILSGSSNAVNATLVGTPGVILSGSSNNVNATLVGTPGVTLSGSSNSVNSTIVGTPSVTLSGSSNAVNATIVGTPSVSIGSNNSINVSQIGGSSIATNNGVNSASVQRVTIATDDLNIKRLTDNHIRLHTYNEWFLIYQSDEEATVNNEGYSAGQYMNYMNNISGTTPSINVLRGFRGTSIAANSEYIYETRFMFPNFYNTMRYDFDISYALLNVTDVETTNYLEFGLRSTPYQAKTHANGAGNIYFRIYTESNSMRLKCGYANRNYNSVSNDFNIDTTLPTNFHFYNKWSIFVYAQGTTAIYGYWTTRNVFTPIASFSNINTSYNAGSNGGMCSYSNLKQYIHIYNNSSNAYNNLICGFSAYSCVRYHINNLLPYSVQSTSTFTHTSAGSTREQICYIAYKATTNVHQRFQLPIIAILSIYPTNMVNANIEYVSDCTPTLTSTTNIGALLLKTDTNVTNTYTNLVIMKKFCPANLSTDLVLSNAYQYLGYNNSTTTLPVILFTGLAAASTYVYNYFWTFYML